MATANDLIEAAYRHIGVIGQGKTMSAYLADIGLKQLNRMLELWSTEPFMVMARTGEDFTVTTAANSFTIGTGGDFDTVRPEQVVGGYIRTGQNGTDYELVEMSLGEYNRIGQKSVGGIPSMFHYEPSYPLGVITFDRNVSAGHTVHLDSYKPLTTFSSLSETVSLSPGYEEAIEYNLAMRLAPANGKQPNPFVIEFARSAIEKLKASRARQRIPVSSLPNDLYSHNGYSVIYDRTRR